MDQDSKQLVKIETLTTDLLAAFAKAQGQFRQPSLNRTAEVKKDGKLLYKTHYADLNECIESVRIPLAENGLSFTQTVNAIGNGWALVLTLRHSSGGSIESVFPINFGGTSQQIGSQLTYLKRYQFSAFFGLAADFDDDANAEHVNQVEFGDGKGKAKAKPKETNAKAPPAPPANPKHTQGAQAPEPPRKPDAAPAPKPTREWNSAPGSITEKQKEAIHHEANIRGIDIIMYLEPRNLSSLSEKAAVELWQELKAMAI